MKRNYYQILNISKSASKDEIKKSYRKLAFEFHPDKNKSADAKEKFIQINLAHETLINDQLRSEYDLTLSQTENENFTSKRESEYYRKSEQEFRRKAEEYANERFERFQKKVERVKIVNDKIQSGCGCVIMLLIVLTIFGMFTINWDSILKPIISWTIIILGIYFIYKILKD